MGSRGSSGVKIVKQTLDEFLGLRGLSSPISDYMMDKYRNPHGLTQRQYDRLQREGEKAENEYRKRRQEAIEQYNQLVKQGKIVPKTNIEILLKVAKGNPDNASVQAARGH